MTRIEYLIQASIAELQQRPQDRMITKALWLKEHFRDDNVIAEKLHEFADNEQAFMIFANNTKTFGRIFSARGRSRRRTSYRNERKRVKRQRTRFTLWAQRTADRMEISMLTTGE